MRACFHHSNPSSTPHSVMAPVVFSPAHSVGLFYPRLNRDAIASQGFAASFFDLTRFEKATSQPFRADIRAKVVTVVRASPKANRKSFTVKSDLRKDCKMDNLDLTDIALELEKLFSIRISQDDIEANFDTTLDIVDFVCTHVGCL